MSDAPITRPRLLLRMRDVIDDAAWTQFVEIYTPFIYGYCRGRGLQETAAADVAGETLFHVFLGLFPIASGRRRTRSPEQVFPIQASRRPQATGEAPTGCFQGSQQRQDQNRTGVS